MSLENEQLEYLEKRIIAENSNPIHFYLVSPTVLNGNYWQESVYRITAEVRDCLIKKN